MPDLVNWRFAVAVIAALIAGAVRGFSGFGSALVLTPSLSALYGPATAVPISLLMELALAVPFVPAAARLVDWQRIGALSLAALATVPVGAWILLSVDPQPMRWAISAIVLLFVAILAFGWRYAGRPNLLATLVAGASSGVLNGATGMAGPPIIFYYLSGPDSAGRARASFIVFFAWVDVLAIMSFWFGSALTIEILGTAVALAVPYLAAAWAGARLFRKADENSYRRVALLILTAIAVMSLAA
jgi:uncharacterized membrane protein YfcA